MGTPSQRRRGLGSELLRRTASLATARTLRIDRILGPTSDHPPDQASAIYKAEGFRFNYLEDEMRRQLNDVTSEFATPDGITLTRWTRKIHASVRGVYNEAFGTRGAEPLSPEVWDGWFDGQPGFRPHGSFVALHRSEIIGFLFSAGEHEPYIDSIGVLPAWRGRGVGSALILTALNAHRSTGETAATLRVNVDNSEAAKLYAQLGFTIHRRHYTFRKASE